MKEISNIFLEIHDYSSKRFIAEEEDVIGKDGN